ncbi:ERF family protein [Ilumatobacter sp.]|uniref:ERF family protein n=1 Tax=Ilumatobacter sp. TaxID=1967498 RepID=UPI0037502E45
MNHPQQKENNMDTPEMMTRFANVLASVEKVVKDQSAKINETFSYKYADINQILAGLKPVLAQHQMSLAQPIEIADGNMVITTLLICTQTGERIAFPGPGFPVKGDPQQAGSAITYMRRYALTSLFALEAHDDDGGIAHRAEATPNMRTEAETQIRLIISTMQKAEVGEFVAAFTDEFGSALSALPESKHGDALTWTKARTGQ